MSNVILDISASPTSGAWSTPSSQQQADNSATIVCRDTFQSTTAPQTATTQPCPQAKQDLSPDPAQAKQDLSPDPAQAKQDLPPGTAQAEHAASQPTSPTARPTSPADKTEPSEPPLEPTASAPEVPQAPMSANPDELGFQIAEAARPAGSNQVSSASLKRTKAHRDGSREDEVRCPAGTHRASASRTKTPVGEFENNAADLELRQQDQLHAEEVFARMQAERRLHIAKLQAIIANLQTEIQRIFEEVALRRQKVHDDLMAKWEKTMFT